MSLLNEIQFLVNYLEVAICSMSRCKEGSRNTNPHKSLKSRVWESHETHTNTHTHTQVFLASYDGKEIVWLENLQAKVVFIGYLSCIE